MSDSDRPSARVALPAYLSIGIVTRAICDDPQVALRFLEKDNLLKRLGSRKGPRMVITERLPGEVIRKILEIRMSEELD